MDCGFKGPERKERWGFDNQRWFEGGIEMFKEDIYKVFLCGMCVKTVFLHSYNP